MTQRIHFIWVERHSLTLGTTSIKMPSVTYSSDVVRLSSVLGCQTIIALAIRDQNVYLMLGNSPKVGLINSFIELLIKKDSYQSFL